MIYHVMKSAYLADPLLAFRPTNSPDPQDRRVSKHATKTALLRYAKAKEAPLRSLINHSIQHEMSYSSSLSRFPMTTKCSKICQEIAVTMFTEIRAEI